MSSLLLLMLLAQVSVCSNWDTTQAFDYPVLFGENTSTTEVALQCVEVDKSSGKLYIAGTLNKQKTLYYSLAQDGIENNGQSLLVSSALQSAQTLKVNICHLDREMGNFDFVTQDNFSFVRINVSTATITKAVRTTQAVSLECYAIN